MRYFAETIHTIDADWVKTMFPMRHIQILRTDLLSFEYDSLKDSFLISDLVDNPDITKVYLDVNSPVEKLESNMLETSDKLRLLWYGRCESVQDEYGSTLNLADYTSKLDSVWKPDSNTESFVSWSSKIHPSVVQPFSTIDEGNLYLVKSLNSIPFSTTGMTDTQQNEKLGISQCNHTTNFISSILEKEYNLIWYGVCDEDSVAFFNLQDSQNIKEVYQFSKEGSSFAGVYYSNDLTRSTITKLEFGNGYLVRLHKNTSEVIPNCAVSKHEEVSTILPTHPLRLESCIINEPTPTPTPEQPTPTPLSSICCEGKMYTRLIDGVADDVNYISAVGSPNGILCWDEILTTNAIQQFSVTLEGTNPENTGLSISTIGDVTNKVFRFETSDGVCYQGTLGGDNIFSVIDPSVVATPTPNPTPTPTPNTTTPCCADKELSIAITKDMAETTNPTGPAGITISGFQEGGVICMASLTEQTESISCMLVTSDGTIGGLITLSVKPSDYNIKYKCTSGKCYSGVLQNTTNEPQILTEV